MQTENISIVQVKITDLKPSEYNPRRLLCKNCGKGFKDYISNNRLFCSKQCYSNWQVGNTHQGFITLNCDYCQKDFEISHSNHSKHIKASPNKSQKLNFCSKQCSGKYFAKHIYDWRCDSIGENNPAWRGGVSEEKSRLCATKRYKDFVKEVLERDNHQCKVCQSNDRLEVHHIIPFYANKELFFVSTNGITLCYKHHQETKQKEEFYITIFNNILSTNRLGIVNG
jgi:endogenous inhibitor of DNA gyrase (YacG/DUF329 family)